MTPRPPRTRRRKVPPQRWWRGARLTRYGKQAISALVLVGTLLLREREPSVPVAKREEDQPPSWATEPPDGVDWGKVSTTGLPIPQKPFSDQKLPPCTEPYQRVINGGCWMVVGTAPCPGVVYEYEERCYQPVASKPTPRLPTSIEE